LTFPVYLEDSFGHEELNFQIHKDTNL
jgi:hypothetical protein